MGFILHLTDVLTVTNFLHHPQILTQSNFKIWIDFLEFLVVILSLGVIWVILVCF